jgi:hypothetical protein
MRLSVVWKLNSLLRTLGSTAFAPYAAHALQRLAQLLYSKKYAKTEFGGVCMTVRAWTFACPSPALWST